MTARQSRTTFTAILIGFLMLTVPSWARAADTVQEMRSPSAITFSSSVPWENAELSVSGPAGVTKWIIAAGGPLEIDASALADWAKQAGVDADGEYTYEVTFAPVLDDATRRVLAEARASGDDSAVKQLQERGVLPAEPIMASGHLRLENGAIVVDSGAPEPQATASVRQPVGAEHSSGTVQPSAPDATAQGIQDPGNRDQVIADDLIVVGSECVGLDCVNNENFGFDTLRLKENNTRIKFEDTSVGSFPSTDWELTANDSSSGGTNRFSITDVTGGKTPFTVVAGAPSNSLYVSSSGNVGIGTSTPGSIELNIKDGDSPTLRLEQDASSGFAAQTWDVAGNETNFFVRDVTGGSQLPFKIRPGAKSNSLVISNDSNIGIGTLSPAAALNVVSSKADDRGFLDVTATSGTTANRIMLYLTNNGKVVYRLKDAVSGAEWANVMGASGYVFNNVNNAGDEFRISNAGDVYITGDFYSNSTKLNVPDYVFQQGYELMPIPELGRFVEENHHLPGVPSSDEIAAAGTVNMSNLQMLLLQKVEELTLYTVAQQKRIDELAKKSDELGRDNEELRARLSAGAATVASEGASQRP